ncbi:hypothetical protein GCM10009554_13200 [Kribbella koreensis]|uniref:Uncharacterized protein n=1 Tax=Kribbella koreensis TaxID=57909 RepID=A0ABP4A2Z2_9ACTN
MGEETESRVAASVPVTPAGAATALVPAVALSPATFGAAAPSPATFGAMALSPVAPSPVALRTAAPSPVAFGATALGAEAFGATALGAEALGAEALGAVAFGVVAFGVVEALCPVGVVPDGGADPDGVGAAEAGTTGSARRASVGGGAMVWALPGADAVAVGNEVMAGRVPSRPVESSWAGEVPEVTGLGRELDAIGGKELPTPPDDTRPREKVLRSDWKARTKGDCSSAGGWLTSRSVVGWRGWGVPGVTRLPTTPLGAVGSSW